MKSAVIFCGMSGSGSSLYKKNGTMYVRVLLLRRNHQKPKYTTVVLSNAISILLDYIHCYTSCNGEIVTLSGVCCLYLWISANKKLTRRAKRPVGDKVTFLSEHCFMFLFMLLYEYKCTCLTKNSLRRPATAITSPTCSKSASPS